jgi:hypothetical protein
LTTGRRACIVGRAAPLRRLALIVGPGDRPCAVLAGRRLVVALGHGGRLAERDDRAAVAVLAPVVDRPTSQPLSIEHVKALRVLRLSSFCASVASRPSSGRSGRRAAMTSQASAVAWERLLSDLLSRSARGPLASALECCSEHDGDPPGNAQRTKMYPTSRARPPSKTAEAIKPPKSSRVLWCSPGSSARRPASGAAGSGG